jgi:hypothetical protein
LKQKYQTLWNANKVAPFEPRRWLSSNDRPGRKICVCYAPTGPRLCKSPGELATIRADACTEPSKMMTVSLRHSEDNSMEKDTNDTLGKVGEVASNFAKDPMKSGSGYYREGSRAIASTVKEQPLGSLVTAGVVGFILALIISR